MQFSKVSGRKNDHKVILYALSTCVWCKMTKQFLNDNSVEYEYLDIDLLEDKDKVRNEILKRSENVSFPTIIIDDKEVIAGFRKDQLREVLKI